MKTAVDETAVTATADMTVTMIGDAIVTTTATVTATVTSLACRPTAVVHALRADTRARRIAAD
eukprot:829660-Rhodomonas_salina.1